MTADRAESAEPTARLLWLPRSLRPPEPVPVSHMRIMWLVGIAAMIAAYDVSLYGLAAKQIQAELNIPDDEVTLVNALFRLGILPALLLSILADRWGRRQLLILTILGSACFTVLTGFTRTQAEFTAAQTFVRMFAYAEDMLCVVVVAEAFDARTRGWALGMLGALGALGAGLAAIMFALIDVLPYGWRALYVIGGIVLLLLAWLRRSLPETARFAAQRARIAAEPRSLAAILSPARYVVTQYPGRIALLAMAVVPFGFAVAAAWTLFPKFLQDVHGFAPWQVTVLVLSGGLIALFGNFVAGRASDYFGRKLVFTLGCLGTSSMFMVLYTAPEPWMAIPAFIGAAFSFFAAEVILAAFGAELFPTSYRSTASAVRLLMWILSGSAGLWAQGPLMNWLGGMGPSVVLLLAVAPLSILAVPFLPEPSRKTLEEISPDRITDTT